MGYIVDAIGFTLTGINFSSDSYCGVCLKKLEPISSKIRNFARAERVVAWNCIVRSDSAVMRTNAPRTRSRTRVCKNQKISLHFSRASSPHPSAAKRKKKWKGNFWFCFAAFSLRKEHYHFITLDCSFLRPHGDRGAPVSAFCGNSKLCAFDGGQW